MYPVLNLRTVYKLHVAQRRDDAIKKRYKKIGGDKTKK